MAKFGNSVCCLRVASSEVLWGVGIISSQVFGHLRSFKGWIQTEACVIPSYHGMLIRNRETNRDIISVAVVPSKQELFVQPKLKNNNVRLIRYNCSTRLWDALYECLAKEIFSVFNLDLNRESVSEPQMLSGRLFQSLGAKYEKAPTSFSGLCYSRYYQESRVLRP